MRLRPFVSVGLCAIVALAGFPQGTRAAVRDSEEPGLTFSWQVPAGDSTQDGTAAVPVIPGYDILKRPGLPEVPFSSELIALPAGSAPTVEILSSDTHRRALPTDFPIAPAPGSVARDSANDIVGGLYDAEAPLLDGAAALAGPTSPVVLEPIGIVRGVSLARLIFYPIVPSDGGALVTTSLSVRVHYNAPGAPEVTVLEDDPLTELLRSRVANPEVFRPAPSQPAATAAGEAAQAALPSVLVEVDSPGLTAVTYEALTASGFGLAGVDPATLGLTRAGAAVRMRWEGDGDTVFEAGERLLFYADPRFNRYTPRDVYTLTATGSAVTRMNTREALTAVTTAGTVTATQVVEQNVIYTPQCACGTLPLGRDGERWTWEALQFVGRPSVGLTFTLPGVRVDQAATVTVWMISYTSLAANPDHRVALTLNGTSLGTTEWDGRQAITQTVTVPANVLVGGTNTLTISLPGIPNLTTEGVWVDGFQVAYASTGGTTSATVTAGPDLRRNTLTMSTSSGGISVYDVTTPASPVFLNAPELNGATVSFNNTAGSQRFHAAAGSAIRNPAALRVPTALSGATGANYLIISHPSFLSSVTPLRDWRVGRGLQVVVEDVQAIYDAYDGGRASADAIAAYIANAYATWSPRPTYVLLVGDGTYDPKRYRANTTTTYVPPLLAVVDPWLGETASDNRYAAVDGSDNLPDLALGRLPVNSVAEAQAVVSKIVSYEQAPAGGLWGILSLFAADNADGAGDFPAASDALIAAHLLPPFHASEAYFSPVPTSALTETRRMITATVNAGLGLLVYNGHASMRQWAGERLFHMDDANQLTNGGRLPVVLSMTCFTGSFHDAGLSTLDESLVRRVGGGAVGTWGPTGLGIASGHDSLADGFLTRVYVNRQPDVGAAILAGKLELAGTGQYLDLIDTFTWLGDPATRVNLATPTVTLTLPLIRR